MFDLAKDFPGIEPSIAASYFDFLSRYASQSCGQLRLLPVSFPRFFGTEASNEVEVSMICNYLPVLYSHQSKTCNFQTKSCFTKVSSALHYAQPTTPDLFQTARTLCYIAYP